MLCYSFWYLHLLIFFGYILCSGTLFLNTMNSRLQDKTWLPADSEFACQFWNEWTSVLFGTASASSLSSSTFLEAYAALLCQHQSQITASPFIRKCLLGKQIFELFVEEIMKMFSSTVGVFPGSEWAFGAWTCPTVSSFGLTLVRAGQ